MPSLLLLLVLATIVSQPIHQVYSYNNHHHHHHHQKHNPDFIAIRNQNRLTGATTSTTAVLHRCAATSMTNTDSNISQDDSGAK